MIHLVHARDPGAAKAWLAEAADDLRENPVPLLIVGVSIGHEALRSMVEAHDIHGTFYIDATGGPVHAMELGDEVLMVQDRQALGEAQAFIDRAHGARQRLDILLVEDTDAPDLSWCGRAATPIKTVSTR